MKNPVSLPESNALKNLPSIDALLQTETAAQNLENLGLPHLTNLAREAVAEVRRRMQTDFSKNIENSSKEELLSTTEKTLLKLIRQEENLKIRRVINATGVIIHTNLGRAPLPEAARQAIFEEASRYCTLEYDSETGKRGKRGSYAEKLLAELTGAEDALIVNNCAAACILVLNALAAGGEAILSRGEMVEIGGDFRIPDVMEQSGAILREVGATNKTRVSDYEKALSEKTRLILKVHPSNYRIIGFAETPSIKELVALARRHDVLVYEDAGSGALLDLSEFGLKDEPVISESVRAGADVVTFSGDKLLGGVQSGLIVGKQGIITKLRKHPLYRALRADKLIYAALEATLKHYRLQQYAEIPVWQMLSLSAQEIERKTESFLKSFLEKADVECGLQAEIIAGKSVIGGGSAPAVQPTTALLALTHPNLSATHLENYLRNCEPPVITRIIEDKVMLDFRTIFPDEEPALLKILLEFCAKNY